MIVPGSTIGMLGSGQLGRMFVHAAQQMGYRVHVFSPGTNTPAGTAADREIAADYLDMDAVRAFARGVDVVTLEFENIPVETVDCITEIVPVHPGRSILEVARNRIREKTTIQSLGLPVPEFAIVKSTDDIARFIERYPERGAVLKSAESGYDGKGQMRIRSSADIETAAKEIDLTSAIIEEFVDYDFEFSVISARNTLGDMRTYDPITNMHENHILDVSVVPSARIDAARCAELKELTESLMTSLSVVGVLCVEYFFAGDGRVLVNEIAPRPHNSGHLTIESAVTSQFEQQVRAVCGLPLGSPEFTSAAAMSNLLGQHLPEAAERYGRLFESPAAKLHLYGKDVRKINRKMGHITVTANDLPTAEANAREARAALIDS